MAFMEDVYRLQVKKKERGKEKDVMCDLWITHGGRTENSCLNEEVEKFK